MQVLRRSLFAAATPQGGSGDREAGRIMHCQRKHRPPRRNRLGPGPGICREDGNPWDAEQANRLRCRGRYMVVTGGASALHVRKKAKRPCIQVPRGLCLEATICT